MRIVAGSAKGRRLAPVPAGTRPVSDRAREGLFSSLGDRVGGAGVLDLFAGTGALGIEALSRGAEHATFVDGAPQAIEAIRTNLDRTGLAERATVVRADVLRFLGRGSPHPCDVVFLDPPYREVEVKAVLEALDRGWLAPGWIVALTRSIRSDTSVIPLNWHPARRLEYGDTQILLFQEA